MTQSWVRLHSGHARDRGIALALDLAFVMQAGLELGATATVARLGPLLRYAIAALDYSVELRLAARDPTHVDAQSNQPKRHVGRQSEVQPPRMAVIDLDMTWQPPEREQAAKQLAGVVRRDALPLSLGGKARPPAWRPRTHRWRIAN